ncbi:MAG: AMP-binding protein [Deltaproteobacteria bacterium]|nr:AMP-binding protein [Deltaproteobacteria bacterium]MBW2137146.1 AMP-binding protein [Deltaproteobacteria bacterium]
MIITEILERNARCYGQETALVERDPQRNRRRHITWEEFEETANRVASALIQRGVEKEDRVMLLMRNCLEWLPLYFGILKTGAWAVPLNFRFTPEEIAYCAEVSEGKTLIFGEEFTGAISEIKGRLGKVKDYVCVGLEEGSPLFGERFEDFLDSGSSERPGGQISLLDDAALYFTSGTTGMPKPVLLTHRNLEFSCVVENRHHNQTHEDVFLCIPPLYHAGAKMHWFGSFIVGGRGVILKGAKPGWILEAISEERATIVWLLVPWAQDILVAIENGDIRLEDYQLEQWRLMHIGAQPVPPSLVKKWKEVFPGHEYDTNYGLCECTGPGVVHLGGENFHKVGAIGKPGFDWECRIVGEAFEDVPPGQVGELVVRGPGVMKEYYKNPEATGETVRGGWLLTGDMARYDEDGFIWLVDRKKDVIISGGENIMPVEVEDFLMENENIQDAAVIGLPDDRLGEVPAAIVKTKPGRGMGEEEVMAYCGGLPKYKRPRKIFFDDVPRNPTGKIEKPKLREKYAGFTESFKIQ